MAKLDKLTQFQVHLTNWAFLALVLVALPYVAGAPFGGWQIMDRETAQVLGIIGFSIALILNIGGAVLFFRRQKKSRKTCWQWCLIHAMFVVVFILVLFQWIEFQWLKDWVVWVSSQLGR